jgi:hypothetical protein
VTNGVAFSGFSGFANSTNYVIVTLNNTLTAGQINFQVDVNGNGQWSTVQMNNRTTGVIV